MGYFLGHKIPEYNPFWEEDTYNDKPNWWKWYHLGHDDGYSTGYDEGSYALHQQSEMSKRINALESLLETRARLDKQLPEEEQQFIRQFMDKYDPKDQTSH